MKWLRIGGTNLQAIISKINQLMLALMLVMMSPVSAFAVDMSALDFYGDLIGKVIPDGSVVNAENELVGHITADGYVVDEENNLLGGVVPQGVAVSVNNSILGKTNNDGTVTTANDSIVGKVLPNGLVVDINYNILGAVVAPGLVYNDDGNIVGRITGNGQFYTLSGQENGFITASGDIYTTSDTEKKVILVGKLISSKMVISPNGKFLGSITPDGKVTDLKRNIIGNIHANGFVYNAEGIVIGHLVERGYAFNLDGSYLGIISYNGEVIDRGATVAYSSLGNKIIGKDGKVIGFALDVSATANTLDGKYLGHLINNGVIVRGRKVVGKIGASGNVIDETGNVIGIINQFGPIFDYLGNVQANAAVNGMVYSLNGAEQGYMQKKYAYDYKGKEIGQLLGNKLNFDNSNNFIGLSGITTILSYQGKKYKISPYGYVFDEKESIGGRNFDLSSVYSPDGNILSHVTANGKVENISLNDKAKLTNTGVLISQENLLLGKIISAEYATNFAGKSLGYTNFSNEIVNMQNSIYAKILPNGNVIKQEEKDLQYLGYADNALLSISINGDYLGENQINGEVKKADEVVGYVTSNQYVVDNMGALYGKTIPFGAVVSSNCKFIGMVSDNGDVRTAKNAYLGTILANNQVVNDNEEVIGFLINPQVVNGQKGAIIGVETPLGTVLNYQNQNLGCQDINKKIRNTQKEIVGQIVPDAPIMNFDNKIIGQTNFNGKISDITGTEIGYVDIDGGAYDNSGEILGSVFEYKVAFDNNNVYLGQVNPAGKVVNEKGQSIGTVNYDGAVVLDDGQLGYALYDLYVYDNEGKTIGYITKNGRVYSIMGDVKGSISKGFCLDKKQNLIGRGSRDYYIRDNQQKIIGYLSLDGKVTNNRNIELGQINDNGEIIDRNGDVIAQANPLQYYQKEIEPKEIVNKPEDSELTPDVENRESKAEAEDTPEQNQTEDGEDEDYTEDDDEYIEDTTDEKTPQTPLSNIIGVAVDANGKIIGQVNDENEVIDSEGNVLYIVDKNGNIIDENGNKIGEFKGQQADKSKAVNSKWFQDIVKGVTISPYDDSNNISNVGPGGGIGPGGRYNPRRAAILNKLYSERRGTLSGKKIDNEVDVAAYTGWQDDWGPVNDGKIISTLRVDMSNMITADKPIPAVIARTVVSLGKAPITAIVERNIYGDMGRNIIIPAGSKIIGIWDGGNTSTRFDNSSGGLKLDLTWKRIIRPDGIAFDISSSQTGDAQGRGGGALGYVDEQLLRKYGMPLFGNIATSALSYLMAVNQDSTGEVETSKQQAANDARENFINKMNEILDKIMEEKEQITPVTYVPAGTRIIIYPMSDLWLRTTKNIEKGEAGAEGHDNSKFIDDEEAEREDAAQGAKNKNGPNNSKQPMNNGGNNAGGVQNQQQKGGNSGASGALPPPSADGSSATPPEENKDEMELDF